jgi:hypothetical protein
LADVAAGYGGWQPIPNPGQGWTPIDSGVGSAWTAIPDTTATWTQIGHS